MRLLLDTHALLWSLREPDQLARDSRRLIEDGGNDVVVSAASVWEIAIKRAQGRLEAPDDVARAIAEQSFRELSVTSEHAGVAGALPTHHRDPFDRMIIAQAIVEGLTIVTRDPRFGAYGVPILAA